MFWCWGKFIESNSSEKIWTSLLKILGRVFFPWQIAILTYITFCKHHGIWYTGRRISANRYRRHCKRYKKFSSSFCDAFVKIEKYGTHPNRWCWVTTYLSVKNATKQRTWSLQKVFFFTSMIFFYYVSVNEFLSQIMSLWNYKCNIGKWFLRTLTQSNVKRVGEKLT